MARDFRKDRNLEAGQKHDKATASAGAAATVTLESIVDEAHLIKKIWFSFSENPAAACALTIAFAGVVKVDVDVTQGGPGPIDLDLLNDGKIGSEVIIQLAGDGGNAIPKINVLYY